MSNPTNCIDATSLRRIHPNDRPPNYRNQKGELCLCQCFICGSHRFVVFGASDLHVCPICRWEEAAEFDWSEMQGLVFESIFCAIRDKFPLANPSVMASLAFDIVEGNTDTAGGAFLYDPQYYIRLYIKEELCEAKFNDSHPANLANHERHAPDFYQPTYPGNGDAPVWLLPGEKIS